MAEVPASAAAATASSHTPSQPQGASHDTASAAAAPEFGWRLHARFLNRCLNSLGSHVSHEVNRMTIVFFALSGLDMLPHSQPDQAAAGLTALDEHVDARRKQEIADWILNLQILPCKENNGVGGFRGATYLGAPYRSPLLSATNAEPAAAEKTQVIPNDCAHLVMTYTALASLAILQVPDLPSRLDRQAILASVRATQQSDGSFASTALGSECDLRFTYAACCISHMLGDWGGVDIPRAAAYVHSSLSYEGAFGQGPLLEAHGGSTFCGVASLKLMGQLDTVLSDREKRALIRWLASRQQTGFNGRPNKDVDSCYSFWVGGTLAVLDCSRFVSAKPLRTFLASVQTPIIGGFSKEEDVTPDPMHTYMSILGLSLAGHQDLPAVNAALTISQRAADRFPIFATAS